MSFDIEKRFRFVSTEDINDEIDDNDYKGEDIKDKSIEEGEENKKYRIMFREDDHSNLKEDLEEEEEDDLEEEEEEE